MNGTSLDSIANPQVVVTVICKADNKEIGKKSEVCNSTYTAYTVTTSNSLMAIHLNFW